MLNEEEREPENGNAPKDGPGNSPAPVWEGRRRTPIKWIVVALVVLILAVTIGIVTVNRDKENLHLGELRGEDIVTNRNFSVDW